MRRPDVSTRPRPWRSIERLPFPVVVALATVAATVAVPWLVGREPVRAVSAATSGETVRPTIAVVLSYHEEYEWQRQIVRGIESELSGVADVRYHEMRTIGVSSPDVLESRGDAALEWLTQLAPDAIIVADDNAMRYVAESPDLVPGIPLVFCGVNWPASNYDLPRPGVGGMVEGSPSRRLLERLKGTLTAGDALVILGVDRPTGRAQAEGFSRDARDLGFTARAELVTTFDAWCDRFVAAQSEAAFVYVLNNVGIVGWDDAAARRLVEEHTATLTATEYAWMTPYVGIAALKRGEEQGAWAARETLRRVADPNARPGPIVMDREVSYSIDAELLDRAGRPIPDALRLLAEVGR